MALRANSKIDLLRHVPLFEHCSKKELALLSHAPRSATVTAVTPVDVLVIIDRDFVMLLDKTPELWLKVARALPERVGADERSDRG